MDNPELIELLGGELDIIINKAHKSGMNYWEIFKLIYNRCQSLIGQSEAEYFLKGGTHE